jgi:hypothetical protein
MTDINPTNPLDSLRAAWLDKWPAALACWSRFVQLSEPRWCFTAEDESREQLSGSFAMIRLVDHTVVISLRQVRDEHLTDFALEILAHEIGHHVYCPADLSDNARLLARIRAGLPTRETLAPMIGNLYTDLLINDRLQRTAGLNIAGVYRQLAIPVQSKLWSLYMRIYEFLWSLQRGELATAATDRRLDTDAQLGARLIRSYAKDWLNGAGRFAALCLPYVLEDTKKSHESLRASWHDTRCAGNGGMPDGLAEIEAGESEGAIHPSEDPELSGIDAGPRVGNASGAGESTARTKGTGVKTMKRYRGPLEYTEVLRATGLDLDPHAITARYYRERAIPHLVSFPVRTVPQTVDPLPEGLDTWDIGSPLEEIDWLGSIQTSPNVIPGLTTRQRLFGSSPGTTPEKQPVDLYLGVDCSGSMGDPSTRLSYPVLAGAIIALSALRVGSRVMVALSGEPGRTITTDGFVRDQTAVLHILTSYLGTGTSFGIHRLDETFRNWPATARPVHILIVSDNDIFSSLERRATNRLGWDVAREAVAKARGGGTYVLELPQYLQQSPNAPPVLDPGRARMQGDGWNVSPVGNMEELVDFARKFSQVSYGRPKVAKEPARGT